MVATVGSTLIPKLTNVFTKLQKAFETVAPMNEELKRTEFDCAFCKKFKLLVDKLSSLFRLRQKIGRENDPSNEK